MENRNEKILQRAIDEFGCFAQLDMVQEECAELIQAICKIKRKGGVTYSKVLKPKHENSVNYALSYHNLCGEVADVRIMLKQLELMLCKETIDLVEQRKIDRLEERLNNLKQ